jgi:hypothetical protein
MFAEIWSSSADLCRDMEAPVLSFAEIWELLCKASVLIFAEIWELLCKASVLMFAEIWELQR